MRVTFKVRSNFFFGILSVLGLNFFSFGENISDWSHVTAITLNTTSSGADVPGDVKHFPVVVKLDASNFNFSQAQGNGQDIRFVTIDGDPMPYEIETWDSNAKSAAIWVKVETVYGNNNTQHFKMYWGNSNAQSKSNGSAVFDTADGYVGVWHLSENGSNITGAYKDATAIHANATGVHMNDEASAAGRIGNCLNLHLNLAQYVKTDAYQPPHLDTPFTFQLWMKLVGGWTSTYEWIAGKGSFRHFRWVHTDANGNAIEDVSHGTEFDCNGCWGAGGKTPVDDDQWHLITGVNDGDTAKVYTDPFRTQGSSDWGSNLTYGDGWDCRSACYATDPHSICPGSEPMVIGNLDGEGESFTFNGLLDEVRVMNGAVDTNYIKLCNENQKADQTLVSVAEPVSTFRHSIGSAVATQWPAMIRIYDCQGNLLFRGSIQRLSDIRKMLAAQNKGSTQSLRVCVVDRQHGESMKEKILFSR